MRHSTTRVSIAVAVGAVLLTSACGLDVPDPGDLIDKAESAAAQATAGGFVSGGDVDCSGINQETLTKFGTATVIMPQVSADNIGQLREGEILAYDSEAVRAAIEELEVLRGLSVLGFGDPGDALDYYKANDEALVALLAQGDPVDPAAIEAYQESYGDLTNFVKYGTSVSAALGEACPDLQAP